jgi:predicted DNA-binding transcriptional regulator AlpA
MDIQELSDSRRPVEPAGEARGLLRDSEVSLLLQVSLATVRRWRMFGQGPRFLKIGASVRYRADDVREWLNSCPQGGTSLSNQSTCNRKQEVA